MQVGIIYNPRSGKLKGFSYASSLSVYFSSKGDSVRIRESSRHYKKSEMIDFLNSLDTLIVVGGDGTFRSLLPILSETKIPVTLFPAGNESLVARQFSIEPSIPDIYDKIKKGHYEAHFFAYLNETPFFLMAGIGLDSSIVKEVDLKRTTGSSALSYIIGGLKALRQYQIPEGELFLNEQDYPPEIVFKGDLIIANSSQYAKKFNPVPEASSQAAFFALRVFKNPGKFGFISDILKSYIFNRAVNLCDSELFYAAEGRVILSEKMPVQLDGDYIGEYEEFNFKKSSSKILFIV